MLKRISLRRRLAGWGLRRTSRLLADPRVPLGPKLLAAGALAYLLLPADLIPDLVPLLGWGDDLALLALAWWWLRRFDRTTP